MAKKRKIKKVSLVTKLKPVTIGKVSIDINTIPIAKMTGFKNPKLNKISKLK